MKAHFIFILIIIFQFNFVNGQIVDSIAMNQVDSLIELCKLYRDKQDGKSAFETIVLAESIALDKFGKYSKEYGACCHNHAKVLELFSKDIDETIRWYKLALSIREVALGKAFFQEVEWQNGLFYRPKF